MKVRTSIKKKDKDDQIVRRKGRLYLINKTNPRRKMRQKSSPPGKKQKRRRPTAHRKLRKKK